jgi:glycosyltransferase involved in cell wall biosynthesis
MHICLLSGGRIFGQPYGEELFTISLGNWLASKRHNVTLLGADYGGIRAKHLSDPIVNEQCKKKMQQRKTKRSSLRYFLYSLRSVIWLFQVLKIISINIKSPVTLIHAQDSGYTGLAAIVSGRLLKIPVMITLHGLRSKEIELEPFHHAGFIKKLLLKIELWLDTFTTKNANNLTADNPSVKTYFGEISDKNIEVLPIGIKTKNFEFSEAKRNLLRKELGIDKKTKVVGYVGRLSPVKNLHNFLISFTSVVEDDPSVNLVLVGEGPVESQLKNYVKKKRLEDKVIFCGPRSDIGSVLSTFDIFVLPSHAEGLSTALLEAMTSGRAIICSDILANRQLITHGQNGLLVNAKDPDAIKEAILLLCHDEALRVNLGRNAKIIASQYDEDIVFPKILNYYLQMEPSGSTSTR